MIDPRRIEEIMLDSLFTPEEVEAAKPKNPEPHVLADMITAKFGFHPLRLMSHDAEIAAMLDQLPDQFQQSKGGGWTFLNGCLASDGSQWTDSHKFVESLFALGIATGRMKCLVPKELWSSMPGGVPYYVVLDKKKREDN